jgi:hypothetical protein
MNNEYFKKKMARLEQEREEQIASLSKEHQQEFRNFERQFNQQPNNDNELNHPANNIKRIL